jgi:CobQ/CobB/MinD/ParA nucleotide binding domain
MSTVHLILQGKGGVGKSFIAALLAQYLQEKGVAVRCFDADPVNSTLASFPALQTTKLDLIESSDKGRRINPRRFDDLVEHIASQPADAHVIVDTGSSAFVPLLHYVVSNEVPAILSQAGHELVVHTVVTGGQALLDTLHGAAQLVRQLDDARFVVWLNPFWGPIADDGKAFEQMKIYQDIKKRIETIVNLPAFTDELFPQDIAGMLKSRLTFKDAIEAPALSLMSRHRLKVAQRDFYSRLDSLAI